MGCGIGTVVRGLRVNFVTRGGPHLASYRLRIALPAAEMSGWDVRVGAYGPADCHIFSKHWDYEDVGKAEGSPCPVFDLCDDWFGRAHDAHYRAMCARCHVVVSSRRLAERVLEETGKVATYIPEPYELPDGCVKEPSSDPLVLWFGHSSNLPTLHKANIPLGTRLLICTNMEGRGVVPYTPQNLQNCLSVCDIVVIPQDKDWKSANRMVESLRAGRFVVASDIPAYRGFDQYLGDIGEGIAWVRRNSGHITPRIISGRDELPFFSPASVGKMWRDFISAAVTKSSVVTSTLTPTANPTSEPTSPT